VQGRPKKRLHPPGHLTIKRTGPQGGAYGQLNALREISDADQPRWASDEALTDAGIPTDNYPKTRMIPGTLKVKCYICPRASKLLSEMLPKKLTKEKNREKDDSVPFRRGGLNHSPLAELQWEKENSGTAAGVQL